MEEKFKAVVNEDFEFSLLRKDLQTLDSISVTPTKTHLVHNHKSVTVELLNSDFSNRTYTLKVNGNRYTVHINNDLDALISEMGLSLGNDTIANEIHAPMPGLILEVSVKENQEVKEGDSLCVLEAMKMENALLAPCDGIIKAVTIKKGQTVDKGDLLIEFKA